MVLAGWKHVQTWDDDEYHLYDLDDDDDAEGDDDCDLYDDHVGNGDCDVLWWWLEV